MTSMFQNPSFVEMAEKLGKSIIEVRWICGLTRYRVALWWCCPAEWLCCQNCVPQEHQHRLPVQSLHKITKTVDWGPPVMRTVYFVFML